MQRWTTFFLLVLLWAPGCGVTQVVDRTEDGVPILIRAPQPDEDDLEELHERFGVQTVVNLRGEKPGEGWFEDERRGVSRIGARWIHLRTSGQSEPTPELVQAFLDLCQDRANWPIMIHCQGGIHRTGLLSALYRMQFQGWPAERAIEEMEDLYFDWSITDRDALKRWLRRYQPDPQRQVVRREGGPVSVAVAATPGEAPGGDERPAGGAAPAGGSSSAP